jgi:hypothetical protein
VVDRSALEEGSLVREGDRIRLKALGACATDHVEIEIAIC